MTIEEELDVELKEAMRARDKQRLDAVRAVKTDMGKKITEPGFSGEVDDELYVEVIGAFTKRMQKTLPEYESLGERGQAMVDKLTWEVEYLSRWLPTKLDEAATRALVATVIDELGAEDVTAKGQVMGRLMKEHKDELDGALVNRVVGELLAGG